MTYLITGGTGHLGSRIIRDLVKEGNRVIAYDILPDISKLEILLNNAEMDMVTVVQGDVLDFDSLMQTIKGNNAKTVIHLAAVLYKAIKAKPRWANMVNTVGTINIFEAARLLGLSKVVWASSNAVFENGPPSEKPITNDAPHYPWGPYGAAKSFCEQMADFYFNEFGVDITATRYGAIIYGAFQERGVSGTIIRQLMLNPALGKPGRVPWGDDTMGWLYVDDAAQATVLACKKSRVQTGAFNIPGHIYSVRDIVNFVKEILPDAIIELLPGYLGISTGWKLETVAAEEELKYRPLWTIKQGIKETINMERRHNGLTLV